MAKSTLSQLIEYVGSADPHRTVPQRPDTAAVARIESAQAREVAGISESVA
ncbi:hypothetical protein ACQP1O_18195 [Nocardia sp. CA-151230]|uniref:hypothetical protein n=1 Tax=Nocardia sp. CA-151230 TaxID=3239982 RepID=UPI003D9379FD